MQRSGTGLNGLARSRGRRRRGEGRDGATEEDSWWRRQASEGIGRREGDREGDGDREDRAKPFLAAGVRVWRRAGNERERDAEEGVGLG